MEKLASRIVVPTDFSTASILAVEAARMLAAQNDASVTLMFVYEPRSSFLGGDGSDPEGQAIDQEDEGKLFARLDQMAKERLGSLPRVKTAVVISDSAARGIVEFAEKEEAGLIVIATHGRTGMSRMLIGSVAERVVRHAHCPVLTLRSQASG